MGATYKSSGIYDDKRQDAVNTFNQGLQVTMRQVLTGEILSPYLDNQFQRFNKGLEAYPDFLDDMDDIELTDTDTWERLKPYRAKKGSTVGVTPVLPTEDNDTKPFFFDI